LNLPLSNTIPVFRLELNNYGLPCFSFEQAEKSPDLGFLSNSFRPSFIPHLVKEAQRTTIEKGI
jgi:hypothetical protein